MEFLNVYIKNICCYVILMTIVFQLFPNDKYIRYVRVFAGFILILIILYPMIHLVGEDFDLADIADNFAVNVGKEELEENIQGYEQMIEERIREMETTE